MSTAVPSPGLPGAVAAELQAQAKVNLRLRILAREESGFHQIETLFLRLRLSDTVRIRRVERGRSLDVSGDFDRTTIGPAEKNLAWRAATAYLDASGDRRGVAIELEKHIPIGGGLGGGSADAAGVLRLLEAMSAEPLGPRKLLSIAATLGADVPFLASECVYALAWGRGERLLALRPPAERAVLLVVPDFGVNTSEAYQWLDADRDAGCAGADSVLLDAGMLGEWDEIRAVAANDFEASVASRRHQVAPIVDVLRALDASLFAQMSGSGSTLFAVAKEDADFRDLAVLDAQPLPFRTIVTGTAAHVETARPLS